ncbi:MAG: hypothetical protein LBU35_00520 [Holosporales bacterium]|jgi:hypothetical protein|nr:hypothetical protein [Holosporales bacterium]
MKKAISTLSILATITIFCEPQAFSRMGNGGTLRLDGTVRNYGRITGRDYGNISGNGTLENRLGFEEKGTDYEPQYPTTVNKSSGFVVLTIPFRQEGITMGEGMSEKTIVDDLSKPLLANCGKLNKDSVLFDLTCSPSDFEANNAVTPPKKITITGNNSDSKLQVLANLGSKTSDAEGFVNLPLKMKETIEIKGDNSEFKSPVILTSNADVTISSEKGIFGGNIMARNGSKLKIGAGKERNVSNGIAWDFSDCSGGGLHLKRETTFLRGSTLQL